MNKAKFDSKMDKERRRAQRDRVLRERRGINEEQEPMFALGQQDIILPDMDTDASEMASKRQIVEKITKTKGHEILTEKMGTLMEPHSADSAELQRAILISFKRIGDLVPEIRRRNKDAILNERRNISVELELEEVLQETPRHVTFSRSESLETPNLQRAAAQKRIKNNRDWVVQCRRRLIYAKPIINGNGALRRSRSSAENNSIPENKQLSAPPPDTSLDKDKPSNGNSVLQKSQSPAENISIPESKQLSVPPPEPMDEDTPCNGNGTLRRSRSSAENISIPESKQLSVPPPDTSLDKGAPADGSPMIPSDIADMPAQDLGDSALRLSPMREIVNTKNTIDLGSLKFQKDLGKGGFGNVILASDLVSEELLALKIIDKSRCTENTIFTEIAILRMATGCPYLMSLRGYMETPIKYVIAMDFMAGGDLYGYMLKFIPFDIETSRLFAAEMVCGLQFLHEHGVIHCDLKPENILLDHTGHIKITDFGLSAMNVPEDAILKERVGTQGYMAPEIMDGKGYNNLADSFPFGVILYMMIVGDQPFYGRGTMEEYRQSLHGDALYFPPGISFDTIDILEGLLCKTPSARFAVTSSIRSHRFFNSTNWSDVESGRADPPFHQDFHGSNKTPYNTADMPAQGLGDANLQISPQREQVYTQKPTDLRNLKFRKDLFKGAFGKVILASDQVSEELLAVNIIDKSRCAGHTISTELEVLTMASECRYLMPLRAFIDTPMTYVIAMNYMAGGDLFGHMEDSMLFNVETTRLFAAEMVCGLQFLHEHGIIHCDLKPETILIEDTGHIKISNFGLSALSVSKDAILNDFVGSKGYIAPEIMDGKGFNHLADSFAFGVILYMMTVGDQPFYGEGSMEEYRQSLHEDIPYFPPGMCFDTTDIIQGLLCKTPFARLAITSSIRSHPFFYSIDWRDVESGRADPPFPYYYDN